MSKTMIMNQISIDSINSDSKNTPIRSNKKQAKPPTTPQGNQAKINIFAPK
jgi:hypothetical protein